MKVTPLLSAAVLYAFAPVAAAQAPANAETIAKVDALFSSITPETPGCAVGIAQKGKTILEKAYGLANLEFDIPNTPSTIFESGSVAKQFTAAAILLLEQDGKLKLTDDIRKYLPEMPNYGDVITVEMLLNHTSGLRDWGSVASASGKGRGSRTFSNAEVLDIAARQKGLNYKPGAEYSYTNTGYNLAAIIVERVSGKSFQEFTGERLFAPLGMTHSQWRDDFDRVIKGRAVAYARSGNGFKQSMPFMNVYGNGGLLTTVGDMLAWNEGLSQNKLGPALSKAMERNAALNDGRKIPYARGVSVQPYRGFTEISHSGSTGGYTTWLARYPDQQLSITFLCNTSPGTGLTGFTLPRALADVFLPPPAGAGKPVATFPDATPLAGLFVNTSTGFPVQVSASGSAVQMAMTGAPPMPMTRETEMRMSAGGGAMPFGATVTYSGTDRFSMEMLDGNRFEHVRTATAKPTPEQLAEYAGAYASDETRATYRIAIEAGQLVVRVDGWPEATLKLNPSYKDAFLSGPMLIRFYRDGAGRITQMSLGDNRMRDLRAAHLK
jgi:CubicO group peptidase (beta-lactamase class C family)